MLVKCVTLNDITYKDKWYKIGTILFIEAKDVRNLERKGAVRRLSKPKIRRVISPVISDVPETKLSYEKIKKGKKRRKRRK